MKIEFYLSPLNQAVRQGKPDVVDFQIKNILKKSQNSSITAVERTLIHLEIAKALRSLNRSDEAVSICDVAISNIPPNCLDLLAALKRLRALLYLDVKDIHNAKIVIDQADGIELILQSGDSLVTRKEQDVTVETWLVTMEIALAEKDLSAAHDYFEKAVSRLSQEEAALRRKRISFLEKRRIEQYYQDISQMLNLYSLVLAHLSGDITAKKNLNDLSNLLKAENVSAMEKGQNANTPLLSKALCVLGNSACIYGISAAEAERWAMFGSGEYLTVTKPANKLELEIEPTEVSTISHQMPTAISSEIDSPLAVTAAAMEKMAAVFERFEKILPDVRSYLREGGVTDFAQRGWSGHLLDIDFNNFLYNVSLLRFTGYIRLKWDETLYDKVVSKGLLPEAVRSGEAYLYTADGYVIDATFKGQNNCTLETAQENFITLVRMCLSIAVEDTRPNILGTAVPELSVLDRTPLIKVNDKTMLFISSGIEEIAFGKRDISDTASLFSPSHEQEDSFWGEEGSEENYNVIEETQISEFDINADDDEILTIV